MEVVAVAMALLLGLAGCRQGGSLGPHDGESVRVGRVLSGQTLEIVRQDDRAVSQLRLLGIDAPDSRQAPWGARARQYLEALALDRPAVVELRDPDRYGRHRGYLWIDGILVNGQIVAAGHALADGNLAEPDYARHLQRAQERARLLGLGIWDPHEPLREHPKAFRAQRRNVPDNGGNPSP